VTLRPSVLSHTIEPLGFLLARCAKIYEIALRITSRVQQAAKTLALGLMFPLKMASSGSPGPASRKQPAGNWSAQSELPSLKLYVTAPRDGR
jgi:hypothetical protein